MRRVVITGMGCVSALGNTSTTTWAGMREGRDPGDLTTIEDPHALQQIRDAVAPAAPPT